ncbi:hypothetical protein OIU84_009768 [Salix udensis]|uniref:Transmembrane protein n=1 Tax=Salix udensis TaxID=889485 RepID=A0AAD6NUZ5_9ROSI|nr:hypothetical protein OIU84_009768 [Salix udensis]KAJ6406109.1 hypothetical protein OIU84_009768 [Salix udensis]
MDNQTKAWISRNVLRNRYVYDYDLQAIALRASPPSPHVDGVHAIAQSQSEVKVEPPEKIALEVENQSEVKVERQLQRSVTLPLVGLKYFSSAAKRTSDHRAPHVPPDEIVLEAGNQSVKQPMNEKTTEWVMLITSVLLEAMSAVFDQVGYALMGIVIAFLALFLSSVYLICKPRKEGVERSHPSGGLLEYYGLAAAVWQCFYSTMEYLYTRKNQQNPIKMCLLPFIFALFVLLFSLFKCRT